MISAPRMLNPLSAAVVYTSSGSPTRIGCRKLLARSLEAASKIRGSVPSVNTIFSDLSLRSRLTDQNQTYCFLSYSIKYTVYSMFLFYTHLTDKTIYSMYFLRNKKRLFFSFKTTIPTCSLSSPSSPLSGIFARRPPSPCLSLFLILYYTVFHASTACVTRRSISIRAALHSFGNFRPAANTLVSRSPPTGSIVFTIPSGKTKCVACS